MEGDGNGMIDRMPMDPDTYERATMLVKLSRPIGADPVATLNAHGLILTPKRYAAIQAETLRCAAEALAKLKAKDLVPHATITIRDYQLAIIAWLRDDAQSSERSHF